MVYETNLLDPMWWVNNLLGSTTMLLVIVEIWMLSFIRKIPNVRAFVFILMGINIFVLIFAVFNGAGLTLGSGLLGLLLVILAIFAWSSYNGS